MPFPAGFLPMRIRTLVACLALLMSAGTGCNTPSTHSTLAMFFDGVPPPPPPGPTREELAAAAAAADGARPRKSGYREHGPYGAKLCTSCHQSTASNTYVVPREQLCAHCHDFKLDKEFLHGPIASGGCTECHDPHSSQYPHLLVAAPEGFCLRCHEQEEVAGNPVHEDVGDDCLECHDPHQSDSEYLLR